MFNFNDVHFILLFLVCDLCFLCCVQEIFAYSEVTKTSSCVFQKIYGSQFIFGSMIQFKLIFQYGDRCQSSFFFPERLFSDAIFPHSLRNSCIQNVIYEHLSVHVSCTCLHHAHFVFYGIQHSSRTGHVNNEKYYKDRSLKLHITQQLKIVLHKYFTLIIFLKQEFRYKKTLGF